MVIVDLHYFLFFMQRIRGTPNMENLTFIKCRSRAAPRSFRLLKKSDLTAPAPAHCLKQVQESARSKGKLTLLKVASVKKDK